MKPTFELWLEIGVWDKDGNIFQRIRQPSRSPVKAFLAVLLSQLKQAQVDGITDTTDASGFSTGLAPFNATAAIGLDANGIVIGTDATAVDITDNKLAAQIAEGEAAGEMLHQAVIFDANVTVADPDCTFEMYRNFNNNSGGTVTVRETAIYAIVQTYCFMIVRDTPEARPIPDGGGCYVKYTLKITE